MPVVSGRHHPTEMIRGLSCFDSIQTIITGADSDAISFMFAHSAFTEYGKNYGFACFITLLGY